MPAVRCDFCWHRCLLAEGKTGPCGVRRNSAGRMTTLGYAQMVASAIDPIEKKPMYHLLPGSRTFSFALFGCNFTCGFCQNHRISQLDSPCWPGAKGYRALPETSAESVFRMMELADVPIMSYTYSEPIVWQDFMFETAHLVHERGKLNCMVTNGSFSEESLGRALELIDAFNIDVKGMHRFYRDYCGGSLQPVLDAIEAIAVRKEKVLEVTTLVIEGIHTSDEIASLARQLADRGVQVWHLSRFLPQYRMSDRASTSELFLSEMLAIAQESGIPHIYAGNSARGDHEKTICPTCKRVLIRSHSYAGEARTDVQRNLKEGTCLSCGTRIYGCFG